MIADYSSRLDNPDTEWTLSKQAFSIITRNFGQPEMDLFATFSNRKCDRYISLFPEIQAFETDAFTLPWNNFYFFAFPPTAMILKTLRKIITDRATGRVVVPDWPNQSWHPLFMSLRTQEVIILEPNSNYLSCPSSSHNERITRSP